MPVPYRAVVRPQVVVSRMRLPLLFVVAIAIIFTLLTVTAHTAQAVESCTVDTGGANDYPGQGDLTKLCVDPAGLPATLSVKWNWDWIGWSGGNTGDACSLYDTDGDGNANYSLCLTVERNPARYRSHRLYSCSNARTDRCSNPTAVSNTSTCTASVQGTAANPADPFPAGDDYPQDTVGSCTINMADFGGAATATFIDVCSYNSREPNSNPVDCVVYRPNFGKLEVRKVLSPSNAPDLFNLLIDNTVAASGVGNGGSTGERVVSAGSHTVGESASGSTNLGDYTTAIVCRDANGTGSIIASGANAGPLNVSITDAADVVCTITNTRRAGTLQVIKTVDWSGIPPNTSQIFEICITGPSYATPNCQTAPYNGATLTWSNLWTGLYNVSETDPGPAWSVTSTSNAVNVTAGATGTTTITNTRKRGSLEVTKVVDWNGVTPDPGRTFEICISGPSYAVPNCLTAGFNGGTLTWSNLIPGSYAVTETDPGSAWAVTITSSPVSVPVDGSTAAVTVTNTRKRGSLTVTKVVDWQGITPDPAATFNICITGPSYAVPNCQSVGYTGGALNWANLLPGSYTISEDSPGAQWTTTISTSPVTIVSGGAGASATVVNQRKLGSLKVTKTVNWSGVTLNPDQEFELCIAGPSYPGGDCRTVGSSGGDVLWENLLPGSYTVSETDPGSTWVVVLPPAAVTVPADGGVAVAAVANTHKLGNLQVDKFVAWNGSTPNPAQTFTICITGPSYPTGDCQVVGYNGGPLVWQNLLPGEYAVTETPAGDQWTTTLVDVPANVVADGTLTKASITNTRKRGSLTVTKVVQWNGIAPDPAQTFRICITGPSYPDGNCQTIGPDGGPLTWTSLVPGDYDITEAVLGSEWSVTIDHTEVTVPGDGSTATASIVNARKLGGLDITKHVDWNGVAPDSSQKFSVCISGPSFPNGDCKVLGATGGAASWTDLVPGSYAVYEDDPGVEWSVTVDKSSVTVPANGGTVAASITNARKRGSLTVSKVVNWKGIAPDTTKTFRICIAGPSYPGGNCQDALYSGGTLQWNDLIPGQYAISEDDPGGDWAVTIDSATVDVPTDGSGAAASVTNTRKLGSLQVTKLVNWNGIEPETGQTFTICIAGPSHDNGDCKTIGASGGVLLWENLIPGSYTVSENSPGSAWDYAVTGSPAAVPTDGGQAIAEVSNTRKLGSLQVTKTVNWNGVTANPTQTFAVCITGPSYPLPNCQNADFDGSVLAWSNLIPGSYTVSETDPGNEWQVEITNSPVVVPANGGQATAAVVNSRKLGSLQVTKTVNWNGIAPDTGKIFQVCILGPSYPTTDCKSVGSTGGIVAWDGLIPGPYSVGEVDPGAQWRVEIDSASVTVPADGGTAAAAITNTRKRGSLTVTKSVNWNGVPVDPAQGFALCITGPSFAVPDCKTTGPNGGGLAWTNLLPGQYDVTEVDPGVAWTVEIDDALATVPETGGGGSATVTNSRKLGSLQVEKTVAWNGVTPLASQNFSICITGPSYPDGDCKTAGYQGGTLLWTDLIPGEYAVSETGPGSEWTVTIPAAAAVVPIDGGRASAAVHNARKLGGLNVTKVVEWNGATAEPGKQFEICITGPSYPAGNCKTAGSSGGVLSWTNLIPGMYALEERDPGSEWQVTATASSVDVPTNGGTASASVTNTRKRGSLTITKLANWNGVPVAGEQEFTICITGPSFPDGDCQSVGATGGVLSWLELIPGRYVVSEPSPGFEWDVAIDPLEINVPLDGGSAAGSVVNTRKLGSLDVAKIVNWNGVPVDNQAAFELCITGPSYPNGNCKPIGFGGGALLWTNLIPGEYAVDETDPGSAWSVTIGGSPATVPADGGEAKADVTNTRKLGSLQVTKTVQWNGITPDGSQSFTLCITGPSYPDGDCQAAGPNGGVLTWSRLIPGEYVVTEADPGDPWTATITGSPARVPLNGGQAEAGITNSRKLGSLQVNKTVLWNGVTPDEDKQFEICIAGPSYPTGDCRNADYDGGVLTWTDLIPGQYSVVETNPGGEWTVQGNGAQVLVPANGGQAAASISNSRKLGSLQVTKTANWNGVAPDAAKQFQICISGPSYPAGNCQAAPSTGAILTWANLIPGSYTVAETNPGEEWQIAVAGSPAAVPADGGQAVAEIANSRKLGSLQVTKAVEWNGLDPDETMTFEICITGPSHPAGDCQVAGHHGAVLTWVDLIPGEYLVAETDPGAAWSVAVIGDTAAVPTDGGQAAASITNTRRHGSLTVTKIVNWNGVPVDESQGFEICIKGPSFPDGDCQTVGHRGGALTWSSLLPGEYVVGEADPGPAWSVILPQAPALVPADGTGAAVEVVNSRKLGSLRVTKVADWQGIPPNPAQTFQVCITGPSFPDGDCRKVGAGGGSLDWTGLIPGPYRVTETDPGSEWTVAGVPADVTLAEDGTQGAVTVTNTRKLGSLQVTKLVNWNGIVAGEAQTFTVCIQGPSYPAGSCQVAGPNGGVLGWQNLVPGEYAISEVDPGKQWFATYSSATVTVPADGTPASATITNTRRRGSLTISKVVNWNGIAVDTNESFEICITGPSFESADCGTVGPNGGALNWGDLLPGVYTVAETNPGAQWSVVISPTQVTVSEDGDNVTASIVNTRRLGVLEVLKVVDWGAAPADNQKVFTICVNGPSFPAGSCKTIGFGGGALTWSGLLPGVYTVTETDPGRAWTVQVAESPVTVPLSGGRVQVTITNTKLPPARITVTKVVSQTTEQQWSFVVRLNGANPKTLTKAQPTAIWENLEPNQSYILSEDDPPVPWTEGAFVCAAAGASTGEEVAEHDMQVTAAANADIACTKYNDEISGTDEEPVDEPGSGYDLFLPAVQR